MSGVAYVRHVGPTGTDRVFDRPPEGLRGKPCPACGQRFLDEPVVLVPLGPGDDREAREKAYMGGWYNAIAIVVHAACAGRRP